MHHRFTSFQHVAVAVTGMSSMTVLLLGRTVLTNDDTDRNDVHGNDRDDENSHDQW